MSDIIGSELLLPFTIGEETGLGFILGRLTFDSPITWNEQLGDPVTNLGGAAVPAIRSAIRHSVDLPTFTSPVGEDTAARRFRMRRQVRSLLNNAPYKMAGLFLQWANDPEQDGWYIPDQGEMVQGAESPLSHGWFDLQNFAWFKVGAPRTHRGAALLSVKDLRTGRTARDFQRTVYSEDFHELPALRLTYLPAGASDVANNVSREALSPVTLPAGRDGGASLLVINQIDLTVLSYETSEASRNLGDVVAYDQRGKTGLPAGAEDPQAYGWEEIYGPDYPYTEGGVPVLENGRVRVVWDATNTPGFKVYVWNGTAYVEQGKMVFREASLAPLSPATVATGSGPYAVAVSPDGTSVYVTNWFDYTVSQFSRNSEGKLTPLSPATVATGTSPFGVAVSADGTSVYVTNYASSTVSQFSRNSEGRLTPLSPATVATGTHPYGVAVSADGTSVYVTNYNSNTVSQFARNSEGKLTPLSPATVATGTNPFNVVVSPDGTSVYVTNEESNTVSQFARNSEGKLTPLSPATVATGTTAYGLAVSADGASVYVTNYGSATVSQFSRNSEGKLTALSPATVATGTHPFGVAVSADGTSVYVTNQGSSTVSQYSRSKETGQLTPLSPATLATGTTAYGVAVSPDGTSVYVTNKGGSTVAQFARNSEGLAPYASILLSAVVREYTPERVVLQATMLASGNSNRLAIDVTLQRGWSGPRFELLPAPRNSSPAVGYLYWTPALVANTSLGLLLSGGAVDNATAGSGATQWTPFSSGSFTSENEMMLLQQAGSVQHNLAVVVASTQIYGEATEAAYGALRNVVIVGLTNYVSVQLGFATQQAQQIMEAEAMTLGSGSTITTDAAASGGKAVTATRTTDANAHVTQATWPNSDYGTYRVFARVKTSVGTSKWKLYAKTSGTTGATKEGAGTSYEWVDLGDIVANASTLEIHAWLSAAGTVSVDRIEAFLVVDQVIGLGGMCAGGRDLAQSVLYDSRVTGTVVSR